MKKIGVFIAGYSSLHVNSLIKMLSIPKSKFKFEAATRIQTMGEPDLSQYAYSDNAFREMLEQFRDRYDICAVLTCVPIEDNFFTRTIQQDTIIATSNQAEELLEKSGRTLIEYYALAICQELVSFEFQRASGLSWKELFHKETRGCLFDFAGIKPQKIAKLKKCYVSTQTLGLLAQHNVDNVVVSYVQEILRRIRRPSLFKAIKQSITSTVLGFVYGGIVIGFVVNIFSSLVLRNAPLSQQQIRFIWLLAGCIPVFPITVYILSWIAYIRQKFSDVNI